VIVPDTARRTEEDTSDAALEAPLRVPRRPVKVAWTREEEFTWRIPASGVIEVKGASPAMAH